MCLLRMFVLLQEMLDPTVGEGVVTAMRKEVHRMELRHAELLRVQERLMQVREGRHNHWHRTWICSADSLQTCVMLPASGALCTAERYCASCGLAYWRAAATALLEAAGLLHLLRKLLARLF